MIFHIQRYSTHDGEGVRTLVFFKGCPLRCSWCCNPESQSFGYDLMYDSRLCKRFGDCMVVAPEAIHLECEGGVKINRDLVGDPLALKDICASRALTLCGESMDCRNILQEIDKDVAFYGNDGGVTLTGGEPLAQGTELLSLLKQLRARRIHVAIETSLHVEWGKIRTCLGLADLFLADLKHVDPFRLRQYTGGDARLVMENLRRLTFTGAPVTIRIPVIPGFNNSMEDMSQILRFVSSLDGISVIHFLPYHTLGVEKYRMLGRAYPHPERKQVTYEELNPFTEMAESLGYRTKIGG